MRQREDDRLRFLVLVATVSWLAQVIGCWFVRIKGVANVLREPKKPTYSTVIGSTVFPTGPVVIISQVVTGADGFIQDLGTMFISGKEAIKDLQRSCQQILDGYEEGMTASVEGTTAASEEMD